MSINDLEPLRDEITRDNALALLSNISCPRCSTDGQFQLFDEVNNGGVGIVCAACGERHPFQRWKIMWLRGDKKRRSNDIATVSKECGAYCYFCGWSFEELKQYGIGTTVHHTRPFAEHGEQSRKIPVCTECHELANFQQRVRQRMERVR